MDYSARLRLKGVLYIRIYISLLKIYKNTHLKPINRKLQVKGVNKRRILQFLTCYNKVRFYTSDFLFKGLN
jgi:hypothetical protein